MGVDIKDCLVVAISSRALFDLQEENQIFEQQGLQAYSKHQLDNEEVILKPGSGFPLVKALLKLNSKEHKRVEVIIMSRNSADTSLRIFNSIAYYDLDITRAVLTSGSALNKYLKAFDVDLFLSADEDDVIKAIQNGFAAGLIYQSSTYDYQEDEQIRIAFDGDAVIFSNEAEEVFQKDGLQAFQQHEKEKADKLLPKGPFANFLATISKLQAECENGNDLIRTALVTARNAPAHERVIKTLRAWNIRIDEAFFLGGIEKTKVLEAFGPHIFFDDQRKHIDRASAVVPSAQVPWIKGE